MDKFKKTKEEAVAHMAILCESPIENSERGIHDALACVFEKGSYSDGAKAVLIAAQWMWANCEETYHATSDK